MSANRVQSVGIEKISYHSDFGSHHTLSPMGPNLIAAPEDFFGVQKYI